MLLGGILPKGLGLGWTGTLIWASRRIVLAGKNVWGQFSGHQAELLDCSWSR